MASAGQESDELGYSWAGKRMEGEVWGLAQRDLNGDGATETLLLKRQSLIVGSFAGTTFQPSFECTWKGDAQAARLDLIDLDGDGRDEAVITAVEQGLPASVVLGIEQKGCKELLSRVRLSLRAVMMPPDGEQTEWTRRLIGQGWSSQQYFTGPIEEYRLDKGKLVSVRKLDLPRRTGLYRFAYLPPEDGQAAVVLYRSAAPLEARVHVRGRKWKKVWRSAERFGSSGNNLPAVQRPALDQVQSYDVAFELPPLVMREQGGVRILMVRYDMPLRGIIGRKPFIKGSRVYGYRPDEAFVFAQWLSTQNMPGDLVDYAVDEGSSGGKLFALIQDNRGAFENPTESMVLRFDLTQVPQPPSSEQSQTTEGSKE